MSAVAPRTKAILAIFDPIAFPTARWLAPSKAAVADTINSGAEVPKATTVRPTIIGVMPKCRAVATAPDTKRSALQTNTIRPRMTAAENNSILESYSRMYMMKAALCVTYFPSATAFTVLKVAMH